MFRNTLEQASVVRIAVLIELRVGANNAIDQEQENNSAKPRRAIKDAMPMPMLQMLPLRRAAVAARFDYPLNMGRGEKSLAGTTLPRNNV